MDYKHNLKLLKVVSMNNTKRRGMNCYNCKHCIAKADASLTVPVVLSKYDDFQDSTAQSESPLEEDKYFCDLICLSEWLNRFIPASPVR